MYICRRTERGSGSLVIVVTLALIIAISSILFLRKNPFNATRTVTPSSEIDVSTAYPEYVQEPLTDDEFVPPDMDFPGIKTELTRILSDGISDSYYFWQTGHISPELEIKVYKNTPGPTLATVGYESAVTDWDIDRHIEIMNDLKPGENVVKDDSVGRDDYYYFADYTELGNQKFMITYFREPGSVIGRTYRFYDDINENLIDITFIFNDRDLTMYVDEGAIYYSEYKNYKDGAFPTPYIKFFSKV